MLQITGVKDLSLAHVKVRKVSIFDGAIYINILISGSSFAVAKLNVIGKVVKVITIFFARMGGYILSIQGKKVAAEDSIEASRLYRNINYSNRRQTVSEIEKEC